MQAGRRVKGPARTARVEDCEGESWIGGGWAENLRKIVGERVVVEL